MDGRPAHNAGAPPPTWSHGAGSRSTPTRRFRSAFEALSNRVGELAKRLTAADPTRFDAPIWRQAGRNRDFVVHHDDRIDRDALWLTVARDFRVLADELPE